MATTNPWPGTAPQFASGWEQQSDPVTIRSNMDVSFPKVRRRYTKAMKTYQVTMVGTKAEGNAVQSFFDLECQGGVNFHTFLHPFENTLQTFRFIESPSVNNLSSQAVTISMSWEQL
jgi:hypothetical protein